MDLATIIGLIVGFGGALGGYLEEGGYIGALFVLSSFLIVMGATVGAIFISTPMQELKLVPSSIKMVLKNTQMDFESLIKSIIDLATVARKDGILALEPMARQIENKFLANGIMMVVDGMDKEATHSIMEAEINAMEQRYARRAKLWELAGGYCPTMGIMGTVMSMISIMRELNDPGSLGPKIAGAFTATLYGVMFANILFFPISEKLKARAHQEAIYMEMCMEAVLSIQAGESPKVIEEKLSVFVENPKASSEEEKQNG